MAQERFELGPLARQIESTHSLHEVEAPLLPLEAATPEQAHAVDQVFAAPQSEDRNSIVDAVNLAAAGMLWHDLVKDTMAPAEDDEEEEKPAVKPEEPEPEE
jgi:hypothetical protein